MKRVLALAGCVLLGSCGNQPTAGGGSDQPNSLQGLVLLANGTPAAGAAARWVSGSWNPRDTTIDSATPVVGQEFKIPTDGRIDTKAPAEGDWHLEILDSATHQLAVVTSLRGSVTLQPAAQWSGVVASHGALPNFIALAGTSRRVAIGPDRSFHLDWLPAGNYRVVGTWSDQVRDLGTRRFEVGESVVDDTLDGDSAQTDLIDLRRLPLRSALRGTFWSDWDTFSGQWYQSADSSSRIDPYAWIRTPTAALHVEDGVSFLRWNFRVGAKPVTIGGETKQPWASVGLWLAPDLRGLDWRDVTAIRLLVRGRGVFRLQVNTHLVDSLGSSGQFSAMFNADSCWHWLEIPVQSLWPQGAILDRGISWKDAATGVYSLMIFASQSDVQLELGAIRVRGSISR